MYPLAIAISGSCEKGSARSYSFLLFDITRQQKRAPPIVIAHVSTVHVSRLLGANRLAPTVKKIAGCQRLEVHFTTGDKGRSWRSALPLIQSVRGKHN